MNLQWLIFWVTNPLIYRIGIVIYLEAFYCHLNKIVVYPGLCVILILQELAAFKYKTKSPRLRELMLSKQSIKQKVLVGWHNYRITD